MEHIKLILLIASFTLPFTFSVVLLFDSKKNLSKKIMAFALLNTALAFFFNYLYFQKEYSIYIPYHSLHAGIELWIYPSIYMYIKSIVHPDNKLKKEIWHLFPGALMIIIASLLFYVYVGNEDLLFFLTNNREGYEFVGLKFNILSISRYIAIAAIAIQAAYYSVAFFTIPKHYDKSLLKEFSNIDNFSLDWINKYNLSFGICGFVAIIFYTFTPIKGYHELFIVFVFSIFSAFVSALGVVSFKQQTTLVNLDEIEVEDTVTTLITDIKDTCLVKRLTDYIEKSQAFLQPDLSLTVVSKELGTNRTYLSSLINQQFGVNFNSYINKYRVDYVCEYLKKHPDTICEELVLIGGFGSKSTMKRAMRKGN